MLGWPEVLLIFSVILLIFGPSKLPEMARALGGAMREFRKATSEFEHEALNLERSLSPNYYQGIPSQALPGRVPTESVSTRNVLDVPLAQPTPSPDETVDAQMLRIAQILGIDTTEKSEDQLKEEISERIKVTSEANEEV
jgi:TatA/E family protein of Tat protein translocase